MKIKNHLFVAILLGLSAGALAKWYNTECQRVGLCRLATGQDGSCGSMKKKDCRDYQNAGGIANVCHIPDGVADVTAQLSYCFFAVKHNHEDGCDMDDNKEPTTCGTIHQITCKWIAEPKVDNPDAGWCAPASMVGLETNLPCKQPQCHFVEPSP